MAGTLSCIVLLLLYSIFSRSLDRYIFEKNIENDYKAWDVKWKTRKAVAVGSFEEFAKAGGLFCYLISEIQSYVYRECLQRGYDNI